MRCFAIVITAGLLTLTAGHRAQTGVPTFGKNELNAGSPVFLKGDTGSFKFEKTSGGHTAVVLFHARTFQSSRHRVSHDRQGQTRVDGRAAIGTDGNVPTIEIDSMKFMLDGKDIPIAKSLFADCFEPHFGNEDLTIKFGPGLNSVIVAMMGSDGAGGYEVTWRLKRDGRHSRSLKQGF